MFRDLTRKKQQLESAECIRILESETRGVLSVQGDDGYPYGVPMNHFYNPEDGCIYFHCGNAGHRVDALRRADKVSYCVCDRGHRNPGEWAWTVRSVIIFGRAALLDDRETVSDITAKLSRRFTQDEAYIAREIAEHAHRTLLIRLTPEHMTGKTITEA